jgi:chromosome segregation ATPase
MNAELITNLIGTLGFPIFCCVCLGFFIFKFYKDYTADSKANMEAVQARCKEREDRLYNEIALNREVNAKAIETISIYAGRLETIQHDVSDIKKDVAEVLAKTE